MRFFTVVDFPKKGNTFGLFKSQYPKQAGNRAFTKLSRMIDLKNNSNKWLVFNIQEIFMNKKTNKIEKGKIYKYLGTRVELVKPIIRNINGHEITYKYKNILASYKKYFDSI